MGVDNEDETHKDNFQDESYIKEVEEENSIGDVDQVEQARYEFEDAVSDEEGDGENREDDNQGVEGDANYVEMSVGRPGLRRTRRS